MATYKQIKDFVRNKYGYMPKSCWITHVKELCGLNPKRSKKTSIIGFRERLTVLNSNFSPSEEIAANCLHDYLRKDVARDDILDALCAAVTAALGANCLSSIPETPEFDNKGLRIKMVYYIPEKF